MQSKYSFSKGFFALFIFFFAVYTFANTKIIDVHFQPSNHHTLIAWITNHTSKPLNNLYYQSNTRIDPHSSNCRPQLRPHQTCLLHLVPKHLTYDAVLTIKNGKQSLLKINKTTTFKFHKVLPLQAQAEKTFPWKLVSGKLNAANFIDFTANPSNPNMMAASTFDPFYLVLSHDGGKTWQRSKQRYYGGECFTWFHNKLFSIGEIGGDFSTFVSSDNGTTWHTVTALSASTAVNLTVSNGKLYELSQDGSIFVTSDAVHWTRLSSAIPNINNSAYLLAVNGKNIMVASSVPDNTQPLFASTDSGNHWHVVSNLEGKPSISAMLNVNGTLYLAYIRYENDSYNTYLEKTSDNGKTWQTLSNNFYDREIDSLTEKNGILYATTAKSYQHAYGEYGEVYTSKNKGLTWTPLGASMHMNTISSFHIINHTPWVATHSHLRQYDTKTKSWSQSDTGISAPMLNTLFVNSKGWLYAGTIYGQLYYSKDQGKTWQGTKGLVYNSQAFPQTPSIFENNSNGEMYLTNDSKDIFYSKDNGQTWTEISGMDSDTSNNVGFLVHDNRLIKILSDARSTNYQIYDSTNDGSKWNLLCSSATSPSQSLFTTGPSHVYIVESDFRHIDYDCNHILTFSPLEDIQSITYDNNSVTGKQDLIVGLEPGAKNGSLQFSSDNGLHWHSLNNKVLSDKYAIYQVTLNYNGQIIIARTGSYGVFYSRDNGVTWHSIGKGPGPHGIINTVTFNGKVFYALGGYNNIYKLNVDTSNMKNHKFKTIS